MTVPPEVPGYILREEIGRGATATVFAATQRHTGRAVAIKIVTAGGGRAKRFLRQATVVQAIGHRSLVRIHDYGEHDGVLYLVMDHVRGEDLQQRLDRDGPLAPADAAALVAEIASAVQALHDAGVVHCDIKPANVLCAGDRVVLTDFGLAEPPVDEDVATGLTHDSEWLHTGDAAPPTAGTGGGTYAYMAPEQWRGEQVGPRTDVYALGGLLFAVLTGRPPFTARTLPELVHDVIVDGVQAPGVSVELDSVVAKAMAREPGRRFASADHVRAALDAAVSGQRVRLPRRRRRWLGTTVAAGLLAVTAVAVALTYVDTGAVMRTVCAQDMALRPEPRSKTTVAALRRGERIEVTDSDHDRRWVYVHTPDGRQGWAVSQFLRPSC
ncbi:serine/threonine protein kinase [Allokutzneria sp. A3M-2-11 16]|uniref:serine/threonine protein kinase n=1 Tax=Allokutzneria sp. A3M-2-11 16 TaxID=2962043 RepID=UPI0020B7BC8F|nr:serine/threonine protein kinase [Allokutzneria sp. A3M-2-11 16]MCP3803409.1 serine/threonine protein kinase [Allokutzneria sp. A3M-2-11 16]